MLIIAEIITFKNDQNMNILARYKLYYVLTLLTQHKRNTLCTIQLLFSKLVCDLELGLVLQQKFHRVSSNQ